jgi:ribose/xylose/arabinose/galactoside ABC-type transport system permease subunit
MSLATQPWFSRLFIKPPLVPLLLAGSLIDGFWTAGNMRILLESVAVDGMIVAGLTIVMIAGGFDLAVGAIMAMGGIAAVVLIPHGLGVSVAGAAGLGALAGLVSGLLVTRLRINPFIATLAVMVVVRGAILAYTGTRPVVGLDDRFLTLGEGRPVPYAFMIMAALLVAAHVALSSLPWGRHVFAVGVDERAAAMAGLRTNRIRISTYVISGFLAGIAGLFLAARLGTGSPIVGEATALTAAAAALIGGATLKGGEGSIPGAFSGLLFIGTLINVMNLLGLSSFYQQMAIGGLLIVLVAGDKLLARLEERTDTT